MIGHVLSALLVGSRMSVFPSAGSGKAVADVRAGSASSDYRGPRASAVDVLATTATRWTFRPWAGGFVPEPRSGWLICGVCDTGDPVIRYWQFHTRPGSATVPHRCDVSVKCRGCAALWVHGIAVCVEDWECRPRVSGLRAVLMRGSSFEPKIWNSGAGRRG